MQTSINSRFFVSSTSSYSMAPGYNLTLLCVTKPCSGEY